MLEVNGGLKSINGGEIRVPSFRDAFVAPDTQQDDKKPVLPAAAASLIPSSPTLYTSIPHPPPSPSLSLSGTVDLGQEN